jgi:hypothetical protein
MAPRHLADAQKLPFRTRPDPAAALVIAGSTLASERAFAQEQTEQITVIAPLNIVRPGDRAAERVYLTQAVGFADLDLRTDPVWCDAVGSCLGTMMREGMRAALAAEMRSRSSFR